VLLDLLERVLFLLEVFLQQVHDFVLAHRLRVGDVLAFGLLVEPPDGRAWRIGRVLA
jgi:hypothetical protein